MGIADNILAVFGVTRTTGPRSNPRDAGEPMQQRLNVVIGGPPNTPVDSIITGDSRQVYGIAPPSTLSPTLLRAADIRSQSIARANLIVVNSDGAAIADHPIAALFATIDQQPLIMQTEFDYYMFGEAYWLLNMGDYDIESGQRVIDRIDRLDPTQVTYSSPGHGKPLTYMYYGQQLDPASLVVFNQYNGTSALQRLQYTLNMEDDTVFFGARDAGLGGPAYAMTSVNYNDASATQRAAEAARATNQFGNRMTSRPIIPLGDKTTLDPIQRPRNEQMAQSLEVVGHRISMDSGVPPVLLSTEQSGVRWSTTRDAMRTMWINTLLPETEVLASIISNALFPQHKYRVRFDLSAIEALGDTKLERANTINKLAAAARLLNEIGYGDIARRIIEDEMQ